MHKAHRALALLMLQGCSLMADFDRFGIGKADTDAGEAAGNWAADAGETPDESPQDAGEIVDVGPDDAGQKPGETRTDAGEIVDAGRVSVDASPQDAGELPPLGPYSAADLTYTSDRTYESCGHASLFVSQWPRSDTSDASCPETLTQVGALVLASDFGHGIADNNCQWIGDPQSKGATFTLDGSTVETVLAYWRTRNPYRMTTVWRGLLCIYKATP